MAVAHDGEASVFDNLTGTTVTLTGKTTAGSNRIALFMIICGQPLAAGFPTYGGTTMTTLTAAVNNLRTFYIVNPPTASSNIVCEFQGGASSGGTMGCVSFNGVDQVTPIRGSVATNTGTSTTPTVDVTSQADDMVVDFMNVANTITGPGGEQTQNFTQAGGSNVIGSSREAGAATVTMSWTVNSAAWQIVAAGLAAAAAGETITIDKWMPGVPANLRPSWLAVPSGMTPPDKAN